MWIVVVVGVALGAVVGYAMCAVLTCGRLTDLADVEAELAASRKRCDQLAEMLAMAMPSDIDTDESEVR